jgi:hypothetical protein
LETSFFLRKEVSWTGGAKMEIEWMAGGKCLQTKAKDKAEGLKTCSKCPSAIWGSPVAAGLLKSGMCTIALGESRVAAELDSIAGKLTGIERFATEESSPSDKIAVLDRILEYAKETGWSLAGLTGDDTRNLLEILIEFCKRAEKKGLDILTGW